MSFEIAGKEHPILYVGACATAVVGVSLYIAATQIVCAAFWSAAKIFHPIKYKESFPLLHVEDRDDGKALCIGDCPVLVHTQENVKGSESTMLD